MSCKETVLIRDLEGARNLSSLVVSQLICRNHKTKTKQQQTLAIPLNERWGVSSALGGERLGESRQCVEPRLGALMFEGSKRGTQDDHRSRCSLQ